MVGTHREILVLMMAVLWTSAVHAIFEQTSSDLNLLEDQLRERWNPPNGRVGSNRDWLPMLVVPPRHIWVESRDDFGAQAESMLSRVFERPNGFIRCPDCNTHRLHLRGKSSLAINNGELAIADLARLREHPQYRSARSMVTIEETASGVLCRITSLEDGRILFYSLADSSMTLDDARPYMNFAREYERRRRGESLAYVFIHLGAYPDPMFQVEWMEQWGKRNQHITGVGISMLSPNFALGLAYRWMFPSHRRASVGLAVYYPLQNVFEPDDDDEDVDELADSVVGQAMVSYAFSSTFGAFLAVGSQGTFSLGLNFFNPILMPFLL